MKVSQVTESAIGKRVKGIFTGLEVTGIIEDIEHTEYNAAVKIKLDNPVQWGDDLYESYWSSGRKSDEFGNLHHTQFI